VEQQKSQEVWSLEVGGIFPSFILAHTTSLWFCFFSVASFWILSVELWVLVFFSFRVRFFGLTLAADQSKSGQCRHVDEEVQVLGHRCTHKELRDLKKKKMQKKTRDR
jgi:hypothetical protein